MDLLGGGCGVPLALTRGERDKMRYSNLSNGNMMISEL